MDASSRPVWHLQRPLLSITSQQAPGGPLIPSQTSPRQQAGAGGRVISWHRSQAGVKTACAWPQDGEFSFSLESVKKLKDLRELQAPSTRNRREVDGSLAPILCRYPKFPEELKPICKERNAREILQRLETIAQDPRMCEICAFAACAGC
ncbi:guanylin isoform X1 [Equus asinus]|uniref:Guanylin n=1 Tax=Equus asinus TaxID=9793 RepID=A0A9L0IIM9_EQUAS|nr:guanylin isoform X1 [Equus asinus]XP_046516432.1 guanylin isoform X1 [Equus quagga]